MIRVVSFIDQEVGWARQARGLGRALSRYERTEVLNWSFGRPGWLGRLWRKARGWGENDLVTIALGIVDRARFLAGYRVVYYAGETTRIPEPVREHLGYADMVWTPSRWGREVLEANGVAPVRVRVVPEGVDPELFVPPRGGTRDDAVFRFLCVGKWEQRKGNAELVQAFLDEFDASEPVELVMHCGDEWGRALDYREELAKELGRASGQQPRVVASDPVRLRHYVRLLQRCHAFVLPTRGEGWGLPILEAMACELPCIVTGYSGLTEFAHEDNCYPIRVAGMCKVHDPEFYDPGQDWGEWAEPDLNHLRSLMRHVYKNREEAREKARRARRESEQLWSWDHAAQVAMLYIRELRG
jgi:glycosyltransferase involved in cell wall biosynthesis